MRWWQGNSIELENCVGTWKGLGGESIWAHANSVYVVILTECCCKNVFQGYVYVSYFVIVSVSVRETFSGVFHPFPSLSNLKKKKLSNSIKTHQRDGYFPFKDVCLVNIWYETEIVLCLFRILLTLYLFKHWLNKKISIQEKKF